MEFEAVSRKGAVCARDKLRYVLITLCVNSARPKVALAFNEEGPPVPRVVFSH